MARLWSIAAINNLSTTASFFFFGDRWKSQEWSRIDPYGAFMINRGNRILILFHLYCCSKEKIVYYTFSECCEPHSFCYYVNILIQNIIEAFDVFYLYALMIGLPWLWDTVRVNLRQKTYCTPPKNCHITPLYLPITATSPLRPLPSVSEVAVVAGGSTVI